MKEFFILLHAEDNNKKTDIPYWKNAKIDLELLDDNLCFSYFWFTKQDISCLHHVFRVLIP